MTIAILQSYNPCVVQWLPLLKLKTNALSKKYENDNSLEMSKLDCKLNYQILNISGNWL